MQQTIVLKRAEDACYVFGNLPISSFYGWIKLGLMPPGVSIGSRSVAWPHHELQRIAAARVAGASDEEIKTLVKALIADRALLLQPSLKGEEHGN